MQQPKRLGLLELKLDARSLNMIIEGWTWDLKHHMWLGCLDINLMLEAWALNMRTTANGCCCTKLLHQHIVICINYELPQLDSSSRIVEWNGWVHGRALWHWEEWNGWLHDKYCTMNPSDKAMRLAMHHAIMPWILTMHCAKGQPPKARCGRKPPPKGEHTCQGTSPLG